MVEDKDGTVCLNGLFVGKLELPNLPRLKVYTTGLSEFSLNYSKEVVIELRFFVGVYLGVFRIEPTREPCFEPTLELAREDLCELN